MSHEPRFPNNLDSTMMAAFDSCEQKFYQEYCLRLAPHATSPDLHAGGAFAYGCEVMRKAIYIDKLPYLQSLTAAVNAFTLFWGMVEDPVDERNPKTFANSLGALWDYFNVYKPDDDPIQPVVGENSMPAVEFSFAIPMRVAHPETGDPILYAGRFDMLGVYNGMVCVLDEKTTKSLSTNWATQWAMRGQFMGYCFAAQQYGYDCSTAVVRGIAIQKTQYKHLQAIVQFNKFHINRWWDQINLRAQRMADCWKNNDWRLSFGDGCASYGGCMYMELCISANPTTWYSDYEERLWDPLKRNPTATHNEVIEDGKERDQNRETQTPEEKRASKITARGYEGCSVEETERPSAKWSDWTNSLE